MQRSRICIVITIEARANANTYFEEEDSLNLHRGLLMPISICCCIEGPKYNEIRRRRISGESWSQSVHHLYSRENPTYGQSVSWNSSATNFNVFRTLYKVKIEKMVKILGTQFSEKWWGGSKNTSLMLVSWFPSGSIIHSS